MANDKNDKNHKMSASEAGTKGGKAPHKKRGEHGTDHDLKSSVNENSDND